MARGDQLARQWRIIQSLITSRLGKSVYDLAENLECHTRTVYRDLEALQAAGFPVYTNIVEGKTIPFNLTELMALYFSRGMMGVLKDTVLYDSLESLFEKIKITLPPAYIEYLKQIEKSLEVKAEPYKQYGQLKDLIGRISDAAIQKKIIEIVYYTMSRKKETRRKVAPYKIWFFDGTFYLIGNCGMRDDVRIFALDRIKNIQPTDETFEISEDFNVDDFMKSSFGVFHGKPVRVRIWFAADIAEYIREKTWHDTQKFETQKDGSIIFEAEVAGTKEIEFWVLKWGAKAKVLAPKSLQDSIRSEIETMRAIYKAP